MFKARKEGFASEPVNGPKLHGKKDGMVYAKDVDPDDPPKDLLCPCCDVKVAFRRAAKSANGGLEQTKQTFVTKAGQKNEHKRGCAYVSVDVKFNMQAPSINTLREAIADGHYLRLNLNFISDGAARFKRPHAYINQPNELRTWKKQHENDYFNVPIDSLDGYVQTIRDIRDFSEEHFQGNQKYINEMLDKIYVHYMGRLQQHKSFVGPNDMSLKKEFAIAATFKNPVAARKNRQDIDFIKGRPVVLEVKPSEYDWGQSRQGFTSAVPADFLARKQIIHFEDRWDAEFRKRVDEMRAQDSFLVVAEPVLKLNEPVSVRKTFDYVAWKVRSVQSLSAEPACDIL